MRNSHLGTRWGMLSLLAVSSTVGQTTFATLNGTVTDQSAAAIPNCIVGVTNKATSAKRSAVTSASGDYLIPNLEPGTYEVTMESPGFRRTLFSDVTLLARQAMRIDGRLEVAAAQAEVVNVTATASITTETGTVAQTKTNRELIDLPVTIGARASGSTSPISTLTAQPGVQTDNLGNISVMGQQPAYMTVSIDGVSSVSIRSSGPLAELFPAQESIAEIKVSQVNNNAEFAMSGDITTVSKSGTNLYHGTGFWNHQNKALDARNPFAATKPHKVMNNYGFYLGGPLSIPKLYNARDKTFFFVSYEGLQLPRQSVDVLSVPSEAFRRGDLSSLNKVIWDPFGNAPFPNNQIPVNPVSKNTLDALYPHANQGAPTSNSLNYVAFFSEPIKSDQYDIRIDHNIGVSQSFFGRWTYKDRSVVTKPTGSPLLGSFDQPEKVWGLSAAHNWVISPNVVNEVRGGFTGRNMERTFGTDASIINQIGITGLPSPGTGANAPNFQIAGYMPTGGAAYSNNRDRTYQITNNLTFNRGQHTLKFGGDFRRLGGFGANVFSTRRLGIYTFNGSFTNLGRNGGAASAANPPIVGDVFAAFLLGVPDTTNVADVRLGDMDTWANHYAVYGQDDWKITSRLTLNYGLRWEYHPMFTDKLLNVTNFAPDYSSVIDGKVVRGAAVVPNEESLALTAPGFRSSIAPTPIVTAEQAGLPFGMRYTEKSSFAPRIGFAWRPFGGTKTVIRGGYGIYIITLLGGLVNAQWGVHASDVPTFTNRLDGGRPALTFPSPFYTTQQDRVGTQDFVQSQMIHYKDPYVAQWSLTVERELASNLGLRLTYSGSRGYDLSTSWDENQVPTNTVGYAQARQTRPYPLWNMLRQVSNGAISKFHSGTIELNHRMSRGLQLQASYSLSKNLSNANGVAPSQFATENGSILSDKFNLGLDVGNVAFTRRHRFLTTFLWDVAVGKGRLWANDLPAAADAIIGGWQLGGICLVQTGPFLTATVPGSDPSGTGFAQKLSDHRPDVVTGMTGNLPSDQRSLNQWFDRSAFTVPQNNIGRFGTAPVGSLVGPGTTALALSLMKIVRFKEQAGVQVGAQVSNLVNHPNYAPPNTTFNTANFGRISNVQTVEGAGPRTMQMVVRLFF